MEWLQGVLTKDKPAVGVYDDGPLKTLLKSLDVPYVDFEIESKDQSIGTMGVFPRAKSGLSVENTITGTMTWGLSIVQE